MLAYLGQLTLPLVDELAGILAGSLGWSDRQKVDEVERARKIIAEKHQVQL